MQKKVEQFSYDDSSYTYQEAVIESVSDVLNLVQEPLKFFGKIMDMKSSEYDIAPLGRTDSRFPRPYPFGIWFRGQGNSSWQINPDIFRSIYAPNGTFDYYEEKHMFHDLRLRSADFPLEGNTNFDLISLMKHHGLPTRLLDWSENILVALFFAVAGNYERNFRERPSSNDLEPVDPKEASLYVLNAYRLNQISSVIESPGIMSPSNLDISLRTAQSEYLYIQDAINTGCIEGRLNFNFQEDKIAKELLWQIDTKKSLDEFGDVNKERIKKLIRPVALIPKRKHPRMTAQLSTFTVHGGKHPYVRQAEASPRYDFIEAPETLHTLNINADKLNGEPFLLKFNISKFAVKRIMVELDRIGITEPVIYPDMEQQIAFMKRRWGVGLSERKIMNLPLLKGNLGDRVIADTDSYKVKLYGGPSKEDGENKRRKS